MVVVKVANSIAKRPVRQITICGAKKTSAARYSSLSECIYWLRSAVCLLKDYFAKSFWKVIKVQK